MVVLGSTILTVEMGAILSTLVEAHQYLSNKGCREVGFIRVSENPLISEGVLRLITGIRILGFRGRGR